MSVRVGLEGISWKVPAEVMTVCCLVGVVVVVVEGVHSVAFDESDAIGFFFLNLGRLKKLSYFISSFVEGMSCLFCIRKDFKAITVKRITRRHY